MTLVTYVVTVEDPFPRQVEKAIREALTSQGIELPESKWSPDNDTICEAYDNPDHVTVVLND